ncbi:Fem-3 mRNA-binding factor 2 [Aphelenchoides besseyi]|nr:Fem-3 mRNA-binding factor 2 [Aphelenchoides besseyi]
MSSMLFPSLNSSQANTDTPAARTSTHNYFDVWTPLETKKEFEFDLRSSVNLTPTPPPVQNTVSEEFVPVPSNSTATIGYPSLVWTGSNGTTSSNETNNYTRTYMEYGLVTPPPMSGPATTLHPNDNVGIVHLLCQGNMSIEQVMNVLNSVPTEELILFFSSMKACRFMNEAMVLNESLRIELATLLQRSDVEVTYKISVNPVGNYMMQSIIGVDESVDRFICTAFINQLHMLTVDKYGCRVVQTLLTRLPLELVHQLVDGMRGFVMEAAVNRHSVHVIHCICQNHTSWLLEKVMNEICEPRKLAFLAEDKFGCRLIQHCLEALSEEITKSYVPPLLDRMVLLLLQNAKRFSTNKYANYIIQFFLTHKAFKRQCEYILETIVLGNILDLAQCQYGSHIVESALQSASPPYLRRIFKEIFDDYKTDRYNRTPLEIMLFNQYGNYVIQRLLAVAIDVVNDRRQGDKNWLVYIAHAVYRNKSAIDRYASGKKIIQSLRTLHPDLFPC